METFDAHYRDPVSPGNTFLIYRLVHRIRTTLAGTDWREEESRP